jgi:hypothetical protein
MLQIIKGYMRDRQDRQRLLGLREMMMGIHELIFPENPEIGFLVRMKTGLRFEQLFEKRFGLMGPDFLEPVASDWDLEREAKILDELAPEHQVRLAIHFDRLAKRTMIERGDPDEWEDSGVATKNVSYVVVYRLLSGWFLSKSIVHSSASREIVKEAQALEDLHYGHIRSMMGIKRGEDAVKEGRTLVGGLRRCRRSHRREQVPLDEAQADGATRVHAEHGEVSVLETDAPRGSVPVASIVADSGHAADDACEASNDLVFRLIVGASEADGVLRLLH